MKGGRCSKKGTERTHTPWVTPSSRRQVGCSVTTSQQLPRSPALASLVSGERHLGRTGGLLLLVCLFFNHNFEVPFSVSLHCETGSAWAGGCCVGNPALAGAPQTLRALWVYRFEASLHKFSRGWKPWENTHEGETNHLLAGTTAGGGLRNELFGLNSAVCAHVT